MTATSRLFIGRERVVREITQGVLAGQPTSFSLIGSKLVGKSQLLSFLAGDDGPLRGEEYASLRPFAFQDGNLVVIVRADCSRSDAQEDLMAFLYEAIAQQVRSEGGIPLEWPLIESQSGSNRRLAQTTRQLSQMGYRLVLLLDNFDKTFANLPSDVVNELRPLTLETALVVATEQPLHDLDRNLAASPLFNVMTQLFVGLIEPEAQRRWLEEYTDQAPSLSAMLPDLTQLTGGHPYLLRRVGDILGEVQQMLPPHQPIGPQHLPLIRLRLAEHGRMLFETLWRRLQNPPARVNKSVALSLLQRMLAGELVASAVTRDETIALNWLINQAVVSCCVGASGIDYALFSPLFAEYLGERMTGSLPNAREPLSQGFASAVRPSASFFDKLTRTEVTLLQYFQSHSHQVIPPDQLLTDVWKRPDATVRRVQEAIRRLRLELEHAEPPIGMIENDRGRGYRFVPMM